MTRLSACAREVLDPINITLLVAAKLYPSVAIASMEFSEPTARYGCVSATIDSKTYLWGGKTTLRDTSHLANLYILDTRKEKWQTRPIEGQHPPGFYYCATAQVGTSLYVYGGYDESGEDTGALYCLDLDIFAWKEISPHIENGPKKKMDCGMVVHNNKIFLFGGYSDDKFTNEIHVFDLPTGTRLLK